MRGNNSSNGNNNKYHNNNNNDDVTNNYERNDDLSKIALFAYQSYIRAYAGIPRALKQRFFSS